MVEDGARVDGGLAIRVAVEASAADRGGQVRVRARRQIRARVVVAAKWTTLDDVRREAARQRTALDDVRREAARQRHGRQEPLIVKRRVGGPDAVERLEAVGEIHDVDDALGGDRRLLGVVHREVVQLEKLLERHHVHVVDRGHVDDHEVEEHAAAGGGPVLLARRVDADVGVDGGVELLVDLDGGDLGLGEHLDELDVVKQVARRVGEAVEQIVLQTLEDLLVRVGLLDELLLLLLELRPLHQHHARQELLLEAAHGDDEVDDRELRKDLGRVVRVGELGAHHERDGLRVLALLIAQLDDQVAALALDLLLEHRVEHRVEHRADPRLDVLDDHRVAKGHAVLQVVTEALVDELRRLDAVLRLAALDPAHALRLRVDHERPLLRARRHDAVLDGEIV